MPVFLTSFFLEMPCSKVQLILSRFTVKIGTTRSEQVQVENNNFMKLEAFCANCECRGKLYRKNRSGEIILLPFFWEKARFWNYFREREREREYDGKKFCPAKHGFGTVKQQAAVVSFGSIFWITIMLITNLVSYQRTKFKIRGSDSGL